MTQVEWMHIAVEIQARWPQREIPEESWEIWFEDLEHLPAEQVRVAVRALYRDGREWAPNGGQILAKVVELDTETAGYGEGWALAKRASLKSDPIVSQQWLTERDPIAAATVRQLCAG